MKSVLFISAMLFLSTYFYAKDSIKAVNGVAIDTIQIISTPLDTTKYNRTRIYTIYNFVNSDSTTILKDKVEDHTRIDITQDKTNTIKDIFNYFYRKKYRIIFSKKKNQKNDTKMACRTFKYQRTIAKTNTGF